MMQEMFHKLVWIDHREARVYAYTREELRETAMLHAPDTTGHIHHTAGTPGAGHALPSKDFLRSVGDAIADARAILIVGPAQAKSELSQYLRDHMPLVAQRVLGQEPLGRLSVGELHAFARRFFAHADRMGLAGK